MADKEYRNEEHLELLGAAQSDSVTVRLSRLINLGDYNNVEIDIAVTSYQKDGEKFGEAFERVFNFVDARLDEKVKLIEGD